MRQVFYHCATPLSKGTFCIFFLAIISLPMPVQVLEDNPWPWHDELCVLPLAFGTIILFYLAICSLQMPVQVLDQNPWTWYATFSLLIPAKVLDYNTWPWYDELSVLSMAIGTIILPSHFLPPNASTGAGPEPLTLVWWTESSTTSHWHHDLSCHFLPPNANTGAGLYPLINWVFCHWLLAPWS